MIRKGYSLYPLVKTQMQGDTPKGGLYDDFLCDLDRMNSEDLDTCKREKRGGNGSRRLSLSFKISPGKY